MDDKCSTVISLLTDVLGSFWLWVGEKCVQLVECGQHMWWGVMTIKSKLMVL